MNFQNTLSVDPFNAIYIDDLIAFHSKFDILDPCDVYLERHASFRQVALLEELQELGEAFSNGDLAAYLDALVDLDYFNLGSILLMGQNHLMGPNNDNAWTILNHLHKDIFKGPTLGNPQPPTPGQYTFLLGSVYTQLGSAFHGVSMAKRNLDPKPHFERAARSLLEVHRSIVDHAFLCGLDFVTAWQRVHDANMRKKRAEKESDSKRGSRFDVIKPEGWVAPDLRDLVGEDQLDRPQIFDKAA